MGYTHYWDVPETIKQEQWDAFTNRAVQIIQASQDLGILLVWESDVVYRVPEVTDRRIRFNGAQGDGHETFFIDRIDDKGFNFCKTARKPYDAPVVACLIEAERLIDDFTWSSDGQGEDDYDLEARELLESLPIASYEDRRG